MRASCFWTGKGRAFGCALNPRTATSGGGAQRGALVLGADRPEGPSLAGAIGLDPLSNQRFGWRALPAARIAPQPFHAMPQALPASPCPVGHSALAWGLPSSCIAGLRKSCMRKGNTRFSSDASICQAPDASFLADSFPDLMARVMVEIFFPVTSAALPAVYCIPLAPLLHATPCAILQGQCHSLPTFRQKSENSFSMLVASRAISRASQNRRKSAAIF